MALPSAVVAGVAGSTLPKELLAKVGSDLIHLFDSSRVAEDLQNKFYEAEVSSVKEFAAMFESTASLRDLLKKDFGLDESESVASRVKVSKLVVAWEAAKARTTKLAEMDGEAEVGEVPKRVALPDFPQCVLHSRSGTAP